MSIDYSRLPMREQLTRICGPLTNVLTMRDARDNLSGICTMFLDDPVSAPIVFGSHRKPEAVLMSHERYLQLTATLRQLAAADALASARADELDIPEKAVEILDMWINGEMSTEDMRHMVRAIFSSGVTIRPAPPV